MTFSSYFRYPHVHGDLMTFVAEDDVWVAPLTGGRAWRVSSLQLPARNPRFSPDGRTLVWTVVQDSAPEVVSAGVDGGGFTRLSYFGHETTRVKGFTPDGDVLVTSAFEESDSRLTWAYALSPDGSGRTRLPFGPVDSVAYGPVVGDERPVVVSSALSREPAWWKRYRGGTGGKLWLDKDGAGEFSRLAAELDGNLADPLWIGDRIAFLSDHEGHGNLYSVRQDGTALRRHTDHEGFYVRHASTDGSRVAFESAGNLFLLNSLDADPVRLDITLGSASTSRRTRPVDVGRYLAGVSPDRTGRASAVEVHGTIHWLTHRNGPSRVVEATAGVRARLARPLGEDSVVYVADHDGAEAVYVARTRSHPAPEPAAVAGAPALPDTAAQGAGAEDDSLPRPVSAAGVNQSVSTPDAAGSTEPAEQGTDGQGAPDQATAEPAAGGTDEPAAVVDPSRAAGETGGAEATPQRFDYPGVTRASTIAASPDGALAAIGTEFGQVLLLDVGAGTLREFAATDTGPVEDLAFSPDSAWLVWAEPVTTDSERSRLRLGNVASAGSAAAIHELTDGRFADFSPQFSPDGRFIAFLSRRSFDPVYDTHGFDLAFPSSTKPYLIPLAATTVSPFGASVDGTAVEPEDPAANGLPGITVDPDGIAERLVAVPVAQGNYTKLAAAPGAFLWLAGEPEGATGDGRAPAGSGAAKPRLERFDIAKAETSTLVGALDDYRLSGDGKRVVVFQDGEVRVLPAAAAVEEHSPECVRVDLSRIRLQLDPVKVWGQAFEEAWRLQRDFYWAPDMAGNDWQGVFDRYRPLVERLGSHDDLVDLLWEVNGELGTSHAYVRPQPVSEPGAGKQGRLGAELARTGAGWEIVRILPGESSDTQARSPLAAAGAGAHPGDIILAVDGMPVPAAGPDALLAGAADKVVELTLRNGAAHADPGSVRRIAVVPVKDEERLRYTDWVLANRRAVRLASDGTFGYLHIPDMLARGWSQLHRDLDVETALDGLIVDVRRNRGGHTSQLVAELIGRKMTAWTMVRGQHPTVYPKGAPRGPVVILTDEFAGSDGDIITQVAKLRGIGPVIGMRTWGGVVGIDGRFTLADGTGVTQPRYAYWFSGGVGWGVENRGVDPDIEVPFPPHAYGNGADPQLEYGVGVLKEMLTEIPTDRPPERAGYRSLAPGALPPRPNQD
ncbi:MAG: S41 family peptidase [Actinomycetales bacterium]